jgi:hypothetical protein
MFGAAMPEHTGLKQTSAHRRRPERTRDEPEADMDNFSAGQSHDAKFEAGMPLNMADPVALLHADDNLGDEAPFPSTWQLLASGDAPND